MYLATFIGYNIYNCRLINVPKSIKINQILIEITMANLPCHICPSHRLAAGLVVSYDSCPSEKNQALILQFINTIQI